MTQNEFNVVLEQHIENVPMYWYTRKKNTPETALIA